MDYTREMIDNQTLIFPIDCINGVPSAEEFFSSLKWIHKWILVMPVGFWFMTISVFIVNLRRVIKHEAKETKSNVLILLVLYPVSIFLYKSGTNWSINTLYMEVISEISSMPLIDSSHFINLKCLHNFLKIFHSFFFENTKK